VLELNSQHWQEICRHPDSYPMVKVGFFHWAMCVTTQLHLAEVMLHVNSATYLHGINMYNFTSTHSKAKRSPFSQKQVPQCRILGLSTQHNI